MANTTTVSTNTIKSFNDTFDIIDDTNDGLQFSDDVLNQYFHSVRLQSTIFEEEKIEYEILNDLDSVQIIEDEETILSQKLSQLSTKTKQEIDSSIIKDKKRCYSSKTSPCTTSKKIKKTKANNDDDDDDINIHETTSKDQMPNYLTMNHKAFVRMIENLLQNTPSVTSSDLQEMAFFMHQIEAIRMKKDITIIYLKSVTGTLTEPELDLIEVDRRVWPMQVKSLLLSNHPMTTTNDVNQPDQQTACEKLINQRLEELNEEIQYYQEKLLAKKNSLIGFTLTMNETIEKFV
ncbi:unnamed protein product, partial [Rotaria sp. Silwood1]